MLRDFRTVIRRTFAHIHAAVRVMDPVYFDCPFSGDMDVALRGRRVRAPQSPAILPPGNPRTVEVSHGALDLDHDSSEHRGLPSYLQGDGGSNMSCIGGSDDYEQIWKYRGHGQ